MEDATLEILKKNYGFTGQNIMSAKEIAEMMTAFIKWLIDDQEIFLGDLSERYITNDTISVNGKTLLTIDELFTYWHTEIYKKQK
jgi:hypothetical protein